MPKTDRFRALYVLKYLWEHTDEEHPVTLVQIQNRRSEQGIDAKRDSRMILSGVSGMFSMADRTFTPFFSRCFCGR